MGHLERVRGQYFCSDSGEPVVLLHGGLVNSNWWGNQVRELRKQYRVVVMDSRGHGRSTRNAEHFGYDLMASDVIGLMDFLKIPKAALVGWSDGAIIDLDIAMKHPERLTRLFAFAANSDPSGVADISGNAVVAAATARAEKEYEQLSPTPGEFPAFVAQIMKMWETQPNWTADDLSKITVPTWIVDGDRDEMIKRENTEFIAAQVPEAGLLLQPGVSHFSVLQDPEQFTADVLHFLRHVMARWAKRRPLERGNRKRHARGSGKAGPGGVRRQSRAKGRKRTTQSRGRPGPARQGCLSGGMRHCSSLDAGL